MVSSSCYETTDLNELVDNENEEAIQSNIEQYFHIRNFRKDLLDNSVEYAAAYEKLFHMVEYADVIMVQYCEHKQRNVPRKTKCQEYHAKKFSDELQSFFVLNKSFCQRSM